MKYKRVGSQENTNRGEFYVLSAVGSMNQPTNDILAKHQEVQVFQDQETSAKVVRYTQERKYYLFGWVMVFEQPNLWEHIRPHFHVAHEGLRLDKTTKMT